MKNEDIKKCLKGIKFYMTIDGKESGEDFDQVYFEAIDEAIARFDTEGEYIEKDRVIELLNHARKLAGPECFHNLRDMEYFENTMINLETFIKHFSTINLEQIKKKIAEELLKDIDTYEADCNLTASETCRECNNTMFESIRDFVKNNVLEGVQNDG